MKHAKKSRAVISAAVLTIIATAAVACSSSLGSSTTSGKGGNVDSAAQNSGQVNATQATALLQRGISQVDQQDWVGAATTFKDVLAANPSNVYANYNLGVIAQRTGNSAEAISYYNKALADNAVYTPAMYNKAFLLESSQPLQAIRMYRQIVGINPRASTAYMRMAFVQAKQGDLTGAEANDAKAISIDPALSKYPLPAAK